ncbi:MAG: N-acetylmuramoyl-L-alanine amidase [Rickettsiales bacterium]|jgi:N-acetylmuramoyl-L-alanine amidase|nr:N-acetylmuramoyl-L-alanine amidase [Rickettsiales bacterium]
MRIIRTILLAAAIAAGQAAPARTMLSQVRAGRPDAATSRIVVESSSVPEYNIFYLDSPRRVVADIMDGDINGIRRDLAALNEISDFRAGVLDNGAARLVFELDAPKKITRPLVLDPIPGSKSYRFCIDLVDADAKEFSVLVSSRKSFSSVKFDLPAPNFPKIPGAQAAVQPAVQAAQAAAAQPAASPAPKPLQPLPAPKPEAPPKPAKRVIVLDPGHGGRDPGTIGRGGTKEKDIVLAVAKQLRDVLKKNPKHEVLMTREGDTFVPLRERAAIGEKHSARLFISIHVNSSPRPAAKGFSIYTLSERASDEESRRIAEAENSADLTGVDTFAAYDPVTKNILGDLLQMKVKEESAKFADETVRHMQKNVQCLDRPNLEAPFTVLRSVTPSVLVEIGFMSNRAEEQLLRLKSHRDKIVAGLALAVNNFFKD